MEENLRNKIFVGDALERLRTLPSDYFHTVISSPPYFRLRDYGHPGQIGLEDAPKEYIKRIVEVFREVRRVLHPEGTAWVNLGDSYNTGERKEKETKREVSNSKSLLQTATRVCGLKKKDLIGIPWRVAFALQEDGWILRQDIIWSKPNPMPSAVKDRCTTSHEYIFLLTKSPKYYYDTDAISEPAVSLIPGHPSFRPHLLENENQRRTVSESKRGKTFQVIKERRNKRSVWTVPTAPSKTSHTATFPRELISNCIKAGTSKIGACRVCGKQYRQKMISECDHPFDPVPPRVFDPFFGSGTTGVVSLDLGCEYTGIEIVSKFAEEAERRIGLRLF
ncbi:site-specific DNA-methyltransferase [Leptospira sp. 201903070]|uniref:Methyltransferase n=1 Tax=Leptospira ainlahdjerensis TaxID=2810033 RepID=A0ABS2UEZ6_9LEPT|nr:site-specific DNA-methyltransferase [Leptospira ainlahdjerensis]MBM9578947.1 site-specific DNA-methyltransferase [Leptospira ainlahdjerensis]